MIQLYLKIVNLTMRIEKYKIQEHSKTDFFDKSNIEIAVQKCYCTFFSTIV